MKELGNNSFEEVIQIIETSRSNAYQKVNEELILMYDHHGKTVRRDRSDLGAANRGRFVTAPRQHPVQMEL